MAEILFDPEQVALKPLAEKVATGGGVGATEDAITFAIQDAQGRARQAVKIIRGICEKRGIPLNMVPVIHRQKGRFRYWDIRAGQNGASNFCGILLTPEWRIASADEQKAHHKDLEERRAVAAEQAKRAAAAEAMSSHAIRTAIDVAINATPPELPKIEQTSAPVVVPVPNPTEKGTKVK